MTMLYFITFPTLLLEDDLLVPTWMPEHLSGNGNSFQRWGADLHISVIIGKEHLVEGDLFAFFDIELIDDDPLILLNFVLVTSYLYNGVHER